MNFQTLNDVLTFAIRKESDARELYLMFRDMVKDPGARSLLNELADQELGHKNLLEKALQDQAIDRIGGKEVIDLHLSDHMVAEEVGPNSNARDIILFAMKMEQASYNLYLTLLENYRGTALEGVLSRLAQEELKHKETLEREYDEHFMQWM